MHRNLIKAAVIVPIYRCRQGDLTLILIRRSEGGVHGGQLAFPGGKKDLSDSSLRDTAIRETQEEIGIPPADIKIIKELAPVETVSTGFRIYPFLASVIKPAAWNFDKREVSEVIEVKIDKLTKRQDINSPLNDFFSIGNDRLWGASYRILSPILPGLQNGELANISPSI